MFTESRYLDTAGISWAAKSGARLIALPSEPAVHSESDIEPPGQVAFYAPNATHAITAIVEQRVLYGGYRYQERQVHPVVANALRPLRRYRNRGGLVTVLTLTDWVTGRSSEVAHVLTESEGNDEITIVDAAQSFGTISVEQHRTLLELVRESAHVIVVGCLHKWLGSAIPLGFALMSADLLNRAPALRDHLAARDYLGWSVGQRRGFIDFPDTFASSLSADVLPMLRVAFGHDNNYLERRIETVATNRSLLARAVQESSLTVLDHAADDSAVLAAHAPTSVTTDVSARLRAAGFIHTVFWNHPGPGQSTLRLSAPLVGLDAATLLEFTSIVQSA